MSNFISVIWGVLFLLLSIPRVAAQTVDTQEKYLWHTRRGVNAGTNLTKKDIDDLKKWNVNLLRISMATMPLMETYPPYALNEGAFLYLDSVLNWCDAVGIGVMIDPHRFPGMQNPWTMMGNDSIWLDFKYHEPIIKLWDAISKRYGARGEVIAAYDLLNEPETSPVIAKGSPGDINLLYRKLVQTIRKNDTRHTISLALPRFYKEGKMYGYHKGISLIELPEDDNLILQNHCYMPEAFTHQNVWSEGANIGYPGVIEGEEWNVRKLRKEQVELIRFSRKNRKIPILTGEFSCPRWTGDDGVAYLKDVITLAEKYGWSWAYHSFRESQVWDAELSQTDRNDLNRYESNARLRLLRSYYRKNRP